MPRCRICDCEEEYENLSEDDCCKKCVNASEDLFEGEEEDIVPGFEVDEESFD